MVLSLDGWTPVGSGGPPRQALRMRCHLPQLSPLCHLGSMSSLDLSCSEHVSGGADHSQRSQPRLAMWGPTGLGPS